MSTTEKTLIAIATYNEIEALPQLVEEIFQHAPDVDLLVVDDNSPDGTGRWCDERAATDDRVRCLHRAGKEGLGTATIAALRYAVENDYAYVINMDGDGSHHPRYLSQLRAQVFSSGDRGKVDVMVGSRYVAGGGIDGWPLHRRLMSHCVNLYARLLLGLPVKDCSGSYRCYDTALLRRLDFDAIRSRGYSVYEELIWRLKRLGGRFGELPIVFCDRQKGRSKIDLPETFRSVGTLLRLGVKNWTGI